MKETMTTGDVIERLVQQAGLRRKLAAEVMRAIPEIIEDGLKNDGEVRVKGLGTFRMKWTQPRVGRNPKTGERVEIPAHNRLVFLPEQSFKEFVNRDNQVLTYKVIPPAEIIPPEEPFIPEPEARQIYEAPPIPEPEIQPVEESSSKIPIEPPVQAKKRRIHWIIPVTLVVIAILCIVFYFRNFYPAEESRQSSVGSRQSAVDSQQSAVGSQQSAVGSQQSAVSSQQSPIDHRPSTIDNRQSTIHLSAEGRHLFRLAREVYGNPFLWVLIYRANQDKIPDPDMLIAGKEISIPALEGKPDKLTHKDSLAVSDGYRLVYEYYQAKGDSRSADFQRASEKYNPNN
jgi:nucleoid DNA-binding protein